MSGYAHFAVQKAVYEKLSGDATLMSLVSGMYDYVPVTAAYPYIAFGEAVHADLSSLQSVGSEATLTLRVFSREGGRKEAASVMERVYALLHQGSLSITGFTLVHMRFESGEIRREDDGASYQGIMRVRVVVRED